MRARNELTSTGISERCGAGHCWCACLGRAVAVKSSHFARNRPYRRVMRPFLALRAAASTPEKNRQASSHWATRGRAMRFRGRPTPPSMSPTAAVTRALALALATSSARLGGIATMGVASSAATTTVIAAKAGSVRTTNASPRNSPRPDVPRGANAARGRSRFELYRDASNTVELNRTVGSERRFRLHVLSRGVDLAE